jgi:RNA polymerase sigma factor (TIGR02999 family)
MATDIATLNRFAAISVPSLIQYGKRFLAGSGARGFLMNAQSDSEFTPLLQAATAGDRKAASDLLPLVYDELRKLAGSRMRRLSPGETLQPTALVHEAYARMVGTGDPGWDGRGHFFAAAAQCMRNILVDRARAKASLKHGGGVKRLDLEDAALPIATPCVDLVALNEVLTRLEQEDLRKGTIVNMRFFAGLTTEEIARAMGISVSTVKREWLYLRRWLYTQLADTERTALRDT